MEDRSRRRARLVLIVGFLIAVLAGAGTFVLSSGSKTEAPPPVATTPVLVASHDVPSRTALMRPLSPMSRVALSLGCAPVPSIRRVFVRVSMFLPFYLWIATLA